MTARTQLKSLPIRVQFTLNPVAHPGAIGLLSQLDQSDLAAAVADLVECGAMVKHSIARGTLAFSAGFVTTVGGASAAPFPVRQSTQVVGAKGQAIDHSPIEPKFRPAPTRPDEIYAS